MYTSSQALLRLSLLASPALLGTIAHGQTHIRSFNIGEAGEQNGFAIAMVGDVNMDGFDDVVIGGPGDWESGLFSPHGRVRMFSGRDGSQLQDRGSSALGEQAFGMRIEALGDLNGDGINEVGILGIASVSPRDYKLTICSGADLNVELYTCFATSGVEELPSFCGIGDVNGDNVPDFLFSDPGISDPFAPHVGVVDVFSGADGSCIDRLVGDNAEEFLGLSVTGIEDLNGDNVPDFAIGSPGHLGGWGRVQVYSGADRTVLFEAVGSTATSHLGHRITSIGDTNGDGKSDLLCSYEHFFMDSGSIDVRSGADGSVLQGFFAAPGHRFGSSIAKAGDINDDGTVDYVVGSRGANGGKGRCTVFSGVDSTTLFMVEGSTIQGPGGGNVMDELGVAVAGGGDMNGDGFPDVAFGSRGDFSYHGMVQIYGRTAPNGGTLCKGLPNSTGQRAALTVTSPSGFTAIANDLTLQVTQLPTNSMGYFIVSSNAHVIPMAGGSAGRLCIASTRMGRYSNAIQNSGTTGAVSFVPDTTMIPIAGAMGSISEAAAPGSVYNFQFWYRHPNPQGAPTSNFSDAVTITFQ